MGAAEDASCAARVAASPESKLCDICGAVGYDESLAVCTQCNERVEHVYCMQALCDSVPPNWVCEGCQNRLYDESCEEQNERLLLKTPFSSQEMKLQNEQCIHGQEREEVKEETPPKIVQSSISLSAEGALQASAGDAKAGCGTVGCEIAPSQDCVDSERFHHALKGLPSNKLPSFSNQGLTKSNFSDSEQVLSFLLPSRPKELLRSNSRLSSVVANKKAGLLPDKEKVTADAYNEHVRKQASLSASGLGMENSCQQSCGNVSHKSQGDMTVEAGWKCDNINSSQVSHMGSESKKFSGNQKDIEARKARQRASEEEADVMETTNRGKTALSGSKQLAPEMRKSSEMVHAGTLEQPSNFFKNGTLVVQKPLPHGLLLGVRPNFSLGTPRYCSPRLPVPQTGSHPFAVSNERQLQPHCFHQPQGRPWRPYGHQEFMPLSQSTDYACELNVSNGDYVPPQFQAVPHVQKVWRGCFSVSASANCSMVYNGIQAHPSNKADPKVWEAALSLPGLLKMKEVKRGLDNNTWPQRFLDNPPTSDNIGMFFFPVNMESHDSWYKPLADRLIAYDLILRAESSSLYLLIFHSQLLPKAEQLWDGRHYLWGVFRTKKSNSIQRASMLQCALNANNSASLNANGEIVDMDIDMVGGADVQPSMALGRGLTLPPLPPGSPPAKPPPPPTPPHHSDEHGDVSLCCEGLPSAPPSPPPTPPQSQQEIIPESSCDLSAITKHKSAAQQGVCPTSNILESLPGGEIKRLQPTPDFVDEIPFSKKPRLEGMKSDVFEILLDAAEPRRLENCSVSSLKRHDGQTILSNSSADGQLEQPSSHGDVTPVAKESIQPALQTSGETLRTTNVKEVSKPLKAVPEPLRSECRNEVERRVVNSRPYSAGQLHVDNSSCLKKVSLDNMNPVFSEMKAGRELEGQSKSRSQVSSNLGGSSCFVSPPWSAQKAVHELESSRREIRLDVSPEDGQAGHFPSKYVGIDLTFSMQDKVCAAPNELADIHALSVNEGLNKEVCNMDEEGAFRDVSVCQQVACLPLFPMEESSAMLDTTGILVDIGSQDGHLSDLSWQAMPLMQHLDEPWYRPHATSDDAKCLFLQSTRQPISDINADLTLLFPQYRKHGNIWIKVESETGSC